MKLFYRKYGNGPPLIILHGLFGSSDNWTTVAKNLADSFTVYLPDQRNHGRSPHSDIHDYESMRDDLHELAMELSLSKFFLAGHSMGGKTAVSFALRWPEMLNGLLVADISPFLSGDSGKPEYTEHARILDTILSVDVASVTSRSMAESLLQQSIKSESVRAFILKNLDRVSGNGFQWKINAVSLRNNLINIMKGIERKDVFRNQVAGFPVIFLKGENSGYIPWEDYEDIRNLFPAAEIIVVKNAGHWIHSDNPEEVVKNLRRLLNS